MDERQRRGLARAYGILIAIAREAAHRDNSLATESRQAASTPTDKNQLAHKESITK